MKSMILYALAALLSCSFTHTSRAFFEERAEYGGKEVSTIHYHLVRALSRCVGFSEIDSQRIADWSQLIDSGELDDPVLGHLEQHFGTRTSPNYKLFHWAKARDLANLKLWVTGRAPLVECTDADCSSVRPVVTGLEPGSHEAFATYLHAVADHYSHEPCLDVGGSMHTSAVSECELDNHFEEFGPDAAERTFQGIKEILKELVWWASYNHTYSSVLPEVMEDTVHRFVTRSDYWRPAERVQIADELYQRCTLLQERTQLPPF